MSTSTKDIKNLDQTNKESFPLHDAILNEKVEIASEFCKNIKAENIHVIDGFNESGDTPLICAIEKENEDIVDILLQSGANPDQKNINGETPLTTAVRNFHPNIITMLIEEGADVNQMNGMDESPLKIATNLENKDCIELLTEFGATFVKKSPQLRTDTNIEDFDYQEAIKGLVQEIIKGKKSPDLQKKFENGISTFTNKYLDKNIISRKETGNTNRIFEQICEANRKTITEKDLLNFVRRIVSSISSSAKHKLLSDEDTHSIYLLSKAETAVEEQITKIKNSTTTTQPVPEKISVNHQKEETNDLSLEELYQKTHESQEMFEVTKEKMLCRTSRHDMVLTEIVTLRPHHPRSPKDAESILKLSKKRISEEPNLLKISKSESKKELSEVQEIINIAKKQKRHFTNNEGHQIDELLRPGKTNHMHIVHFPSDNFENEQKELLIEALKTGATIHHFQYPECAETTNDLVFAGIAAVNKLLDENIHPDKIILQGVGEEAVAANDTALQFEKRDIFLTRIFMDHDIIPSYSDHRDISLTSTRKPSRSCDPDMKNFISGFNKILKAQPNNTGLYFSKDKNPITISQLLNLYIKKTQQFYHTHPKYKNTSLPKERVESIIGLTDIDES